MGWKRGTPATHKIEVANSDLGPIIRALHLAALQIEEDPGVQEACRRLIEALYREVREWKE